MLVYDFHHVLIHTCESASLVVDPYFYYRNISMSELGYVSMCNSKNTHTHTQLSGGLALTT